MTYPEAHQQIVAALLAGKFILFKSPLFSSLKGHTDFYKAFFDKSYGYALEHSRDYFFLSSQDTGEETSQDLLLFLALLAYEFHNEQRDFLQELTHSTFDVAEMEGLLKRSSKYDDLIKNTQAEDFPRFINGWHNRNLLSYVDSDRRKFRFNAPIYTFLDVAFHLAQEHLQEVAVEESQPLIGGLG